MRSRFLVFLGVELFVAFLIVGGLSFFLLYPQLVEKANAALREEGRSRARIIATSVADHCTEPMLDEDEFVLGLILSKTAKEYGEIKWIGIVDTEGEAIAHTDQKLANKKLVLPAGIQPVRDGDFLSAFYGDEMESLWASYPVVIRGTRMGTVHLSMLIEPDGIGLALSSLRTKAVIVYAGLGAACTLLLLLFSSIPLRHMARDRQKRGDYARRGEEVSSEETARKREEETQIAERISSMKKKEKEMIARLRILKSQAETHEKKGEMEIAPRFASAKGESETPPGPDEAEKSGTPARKMPEKEKIEAIRRRIHELEERIGKD